MLVDVPVEVERSKPMFKMVLSQMDFTLKSDDLTFFIIVFQLPL